MAGRQGEVGAGWWLAVHECQPEEWDDLTAGSPLFANSRWLRATIGRLEGAHRWLVLAEGGLPAVGVVGTVISDPRGYAMTNLHTLLHEGIAPTVALGRPDGGRLAGFSRGRAEDWFPNLVCTYPGYASFLVGPRRQSEPSVRRLLLAVIAWARRAGLHAVGFPHVRADDLLLSRALAGCGFTGFPLTSAAELDLPGQSFAHYLSSLSTNHRKQVQRDRRVLRQSGVHIVERPLAGCVDEVLRLRLAHRAKYGHRASAADERVQLERFVEVFGWDAVVFCAQAEDRIVSFCLVLKDSPATWYALMTGSDYADARGRHAYFASNYYGPIEAAYSSGVRSIAYGIAAEEAKRRRGCRLVSVRTWIQPIGRWPSRAQVEEAGIHQT